MKNKAIWIFLFSFGMGAGAHATPPNITVQPLDRSVSVGQAPFFSVGAEGDAPLVYQWRKNGVDIPGAKSFFLYVFNAQLSENGALYSCVVSNAEGAVTSRNAVLSVTDKALAILVQPKNATVLEGQSATFFIEAQGPPPLHYLWYMNFQAMTSPIPGATEPSYTIPVVTMADNGKKFQCTVGSDISGTGSAMVLLTVLPNTTPFAITEHPLSQTIAAGQSATFSVKAVASLPISYQWQKNGVNIIGATGDTYTTPPITTSDAGIPYRCVLSIIGDSLVSNPATLVLAMPPKIESEPVDLSVSVGQSPSFTIQVSGTPPFTYQWRKSGVLPMGTNSATLTLPNVGLVQDEGSFSCLVTNAAGTVESRSALLRVSATPLAITVQPQSQNVIEGAPVVFSVSVEGPHSIRYQWKRNGVAIPGALANSYQIPSAALSDSGAQFSCSIVTDLLTIESASAKLTVSEPDGPLGFSVQPRSQVVAANQYVVFTAVASNKEPVSYQWEKNNSPLVESVTLTGTNTALLSIAGAKPEDAGEYKCVIKNSMGALNSDPATLTVTSGGSVGEPICQMKKEGDLTLESGEYYLDSASIDPLNGYAYFSKDGYPGHVTKIRLSDFKATDSLDLTANIDRLLVSAIDAARGYLYVGSNVTRTVSKINLSDFSEADSLQANLEDIPLQMAGFSSVLLDAANGFAYLGTDLNPARIVKIRLSDFKQVGLIVLEPNEKELGPASIDLINGYSYFVTYPPYNGSTFASRLIKIRLSDFTRVGTLDMRPGQWGFVTSLIDPVNQYLYLTRTGPPDTIIKINLASLRQGLSLGVDMGIRASSIDLPQGVAYFAGYENGGAYRPLVKKIRLENLEILDTIVLNDIESVPNSAVMDPINRFLYLGTHDNPGRIYKVNVGCHPAHPADTNADSQISQDEVTGYGACWMNAPDIPEGCPVNASMDNAVRAGTLWHATADGKYEYNLNKNCPLCWEVKP